ncbi:hypothetical protein GUJ93_ZPchr0016g2577 [Zizania palustris]|uniref:Uncharacterized protein n=1 Tax=Zizania palustris TaxID=103762 RepID=A0A8J5W153_ZIZPA|nr:hypothetical protein GUJ93_ZPchr0016g2577 [Zizania palustris]
MAATSSAVRVTSTPTLGGSTIATQESSSSPFNKRSSRSFPMRTFEVSSTLDSSEEELRMSSEDREDEGKGSLALHAAYFTRVLTTLEVPAAAFLFRETCPAESKLG